MSLDQEIIEYLLAHPKSSAREVGSSLGESKSTINARLYRLRQQSLVVMEEFRWWVSQVDDPETIDICDIPFPDWLGTDDVREEDLSDLVNQWASLKEARESLKSQLDELDGRIAAIQDTLSDHAPEDGVEIITGEEYEATVQRSMQVVFPRKTVDEERDKQAELERRLRKSSFWHDVSGLEASRLRSLWSDRESIPAELNSILSSYAVMEEKTKLSLRKRRKR